MEQSNIKSLRKGVLKITLLKDNINVIVPCTFLDGITCKNKPKYTVNNSNVLYNKSKNEWVCDEHLTWAISKLESTVINKNYHHYLSKEAYNLEHTILFQYIWDNKDFICFFKDKSDKKCYNYVVKWNISLINKDNKNKKNYIVCNYHFKKAIKELIKYNNGRI